MIHLLYFEFSCFYIKYGSHNDLNVQKQFFMLLKPHLQTFLKRLLKNILNPYLYYQLSYFSMSR